MFLLVPVFGWCCLFAIPVKWVYFANTIDNPFLFLCHIPLYDYTSVYISTLLLMGNWVVSSVELP